MQEKKLIKFGKLVFAVALSLALSAADAHAYIGPGAGFAFLGSAFVFILTIAMAVATLAFWPIQWLWRKLTGKGFPKNARAKRVIVLGLDGLSPWLVDKYMAQGKLPNMKRLSEEGCYSRLGTTLPALSPVAWSTFQTGVNPGAHNIFDFLTRDKRFCLPHLSSTDTEPCRRVLKLGRWVLPLGRAKVQLLRKSQPFWKVLAKHGVFSNVIRVPISYPPEKFKGNILSAMCVPDLKGTQGSFSVFFTGDNKNGAKHTGGEFKLLSRQGDVIEGAIEGPPHPFKMDGKPLLAPFKLTVRPAQGEAELQIGRERELLKIDQFSRWIELEFRYGLGKKISGICRFCLRKVDPDLFLYVSPINVNPAKPVLPIAHPIFFSTFFAKRHGPFGTLGLMEDTWGRNEFALDDARFLQQAWLTHDEREKMFLETLDKTRQGMCACVFDASDRIQHMFWRYIDEGHPSPKEDGPFKEAIPQMYEKMDALVGKVLERLRPDDALIVLSDHGFTSFRRCVNLNTWLHEQGYLVLKEGAALDGDYLRDVDWSRTKAFSIGLSGIYLNRKGREKRGIVDEGEAAGLKAEIAGKLERIVDPKTEKRPIRKVYDAEREYRGVYKKESCDLIVGCDHGYRVSWESVTGGIRPEVFEDNLKAWSGDHDVDPELVKGIFLSNKRLKDGGEEPRIIDMAPTVLDLFSVPVPKYMEGRAVV